MRCCAGIPSQLQSRETRLSQTGGPLSENRMAGIPCVLKTFFILRMVSMVFTCLDIAEISTPREISPRVKNRLSLRAGRSLH